MIRLKSLAKTGKLGSVRITMHANRVQALLGKPDYTGGGSRKYPWENIWRYGDLELGFDASSRELAHIAINFWGETKNPEQGEHLSYDPWIVRGALPVEDFIDSCTKEGIAVRELEEPWNEGAREFVTAGGMHLIFGETDEGNLLGLVKFVVSGHVYT